MNLIKNKETVKDVAILGDLTHFNGHFQSEGTIMIQGEYAGSIDSDSVIITRHGKINAFIRSKNLEVWGVLDGFVRSEKVVCRSTSQINGIIMSCGIAIEPGTVFGGGLTFPQTGEGDEK